MSWKPMDVGYSKFLVFSHEMRPSVSRTGIHLRTFIQGDVEACHFAGLDAPDLELQEAIGFEENTRPRWIGHAAWQIDSCLSLS